MDGIRFASYVAGRILSLVISRVVSYRVGKPPHPWSLLVELCISHEFPGYLAPWWSLELAASTGHLLSANRLVVGSRIRKTWDDSELEDLASSSDDSRMSWLLVYLVLAPWGRPYLATATTVISICMASVWAILAHAFIFPARLHSSELMGLFYLSRVPFRGNEALNFVFGGCSRVAKTISAHIIFSAFRCASLLLTEPTARYLLGAATEPCRGTDTSR